MNTVTRNFTLTGVALLLLLTACGQGGRQLQKAVDLAVQGSCDVATTECLASGHGVSVKLSLGPNVKVLEPFPIGLTAVTPDADPVREVNVDFNMRDMDMGINRYKLQSTGQGWTGKGIIPVCVTGRNDWIAIVEIVTDEGSYRAVFPFKTGS